VIDVLRSNLDESVNFVDTLGYGEAIESRYVRRTSDEVIVYLSSQTACAERCRFCHLTATGQVIPSSVTAQTIEDQALRVLLHYRSKHSPALFVNFNFMARGEPMRSDVSWPDVFRRLADRARQFELIPRFKISTILPNDTGSLCFKFGEFAPDIYYSLYSLRDTFRRRWMPNAAPFEKGLRLLADWQRFSHKIPRVHLALIAGENDAPEDVEALARAVTGALRVDFNVVRYNPPNDHTKEGDYREAARILAKYAPTQVVDRVGFDVKASCGMFT